MPKVQPTPIASTPRGWWAEILERKAERHERSRKIELLREQRRVDARRAIANGFTITDVARFYGCHPSTISGLIRETA